MDSTIKKSRRAMLQKSATLLAGMGMMVIFMRNESAVAGTASKTDLNYQNSPRNGKRCATCTAFIPDGQGGGGTCRIVEGTVTPNGWCMAYSERK